ncbi:hypothetical protein A359_08760 [secondary endosymbiont of Ctenarytaina eucalypti]|uniref:Uncharacterized protein n=1 Tax=secondary endosymbiont of Ctenarytaina eucalypti TaxID=1199245 RepID=J3TFY3_9ENTR|nr:hypothetical protein A359_08760 [secondary endosymbiont of Ctenarytaina eucalypti]
MYMLEIFFYWEKLSKIMAAILTSCRAQIRESQGVIIVPKMRHDCHWHLFVSRYSFIGKERSLIFRMHYGKE